jgi:hypothetical protein
MITKIAETIGAICAFTIYLFAGDHRRRHESFASRIDFVQILISDFKFNGRISRMELKEGQRVRLKVAPKTARGHAASIEAGSGRWISSDESVVSVEQDPTNELAAIVRGLDGSANESVSIEFRGDADRSAEGIREIVGTLAVVCTSGDAAVVDITPGTPEDDTAPATGTSGTGSAGPGEPTGNNPNTSTDLNPPPESPATETTDTTDNG